MGPAEVGVRIAAPGPTLISLLFIMGAATLLAGVVARSTAFVAAEGPLHAIGLLVVLRCATALSFRVLLAVAAQLLVLAWMAGEREWILRTGQVVYLRTAPIDPRDLFRGDVRYDCYIAVIRGGVFRCHSPCKIKQYSSCVNSP